MKTVVLTLERTHIQAIPVEIPEWWDNKTARERLSYPKYMADLEDLADPDDWEPALGVARIVGVAEPAGHVFPVASFGADDPLPAHQDQMDFKL